MASSRVLPASYNTHTFGDATRDYQSIAAWETAHTIALGGVGEVLDCYDDAASFSDTGITVAGATGTSATVFRLIRAPAGQRHDGTPNNGFTLQSTVANTILTFQETYSQVHDLIVKNLVTSSASNFSTIRLITSNQKAIGCIVKGTNGGTGEGRGMLAGNLCYFINCLAYECKTFGFQLSAGSGEYCYAYNCTAINCTKGFGMDWQAGGTCILTNCIGQDNTTGDFVSDGIVTVVANHCLSKDSTANDWGGDDNHEGVTLTFRDAVGDDWHLDSTDTDAIGGGHDLSATFDDDIDFTVRSSWDIGFDEYVAVAALSISLSENINF